MKNVSVDLWTQESTDAELIAAVRTGDSAAYGTLFERHEGAASRVASKYSLVPSDIDDIVSEAFIRVLKALQEGRGPNISFRAYLFTVVRRTGLEFIKRDKQVRPNEDMTIHEKAVGYSASSDEQSLMEFETSVVAIAYRSLPERWQAILWYTEIEKRTPAEVAPLLGLTANGAAALAYRARSALRGAYLQHHLATTEDTACLTVFDSLSGYVRGELGKRERFRVEAHLNVCQRCASIIGELEDVNRALCA